MTAALRYRAVLFDLDGTLVDSIGALTEAVNHARRTEGLCDLPGSRVRSLVGEGIDRLLQRAFDRADVHPEIVRAFESRYDEICCAESRVLTGVGATLAALSDLGIQMAVCTNKPTVFSRKILEFLGLARHFSAIVGPDLAGARKPDPRHLAVTLQSVTCDPADALFVGDMPIDVSAARNTGIDVAVIATGSSTREELMDSQPDHFLESFADLLKVVRREAA